MNAPRRRWVLSDQPKAGRWIGAFLKPCSVFNTVHLLLCPGLITALRSRRAQPQTMTSLHPHVRAKFFTRWSSAVFTSGTSVTSHYLQIMFLCSVVGLQDRSTWFLWNVLRQGRKTACVLSLKHFRSNNSLSVTYNLALNLIRSHLGLFVSLNGISWFSLQSCW